MKSKLYSIVLLGMIFPVNAQFSTPNTGVKWTLDSIALHSPSTVTVEENVYTLHENLVVETTDSLLINKALTLKINAGVEIGVRGYFHSEPENSEEIVAITSTEMSTPYKGFWMFDTSKVIFRRTYVEHGGGIRVITPTFIMENCVVSNNHNSSGSSTGGAITFSNGEPIIRNSIFENNIHPALGSAANAEVYALIENNVFTHNNLTNNNRPQINMGPSGNGGVLRIINNMVIGNPEHNMVGGIAVASLTGIPTQMEIRDNIVTNNRYGVTAIGPVGGEIVNNLLEDNDAETNPMNGGSGISLYNTALVKVRGNEIRRNLWGITLIGTTVADLGTEEDPGNNTFSENGNGGEIFALFNNTTNTISALKNCWIEGQSSTAEDVEGVISHQVDDPALGEVLFDPFECGVMAVDDFASVSFRLYPNPTKNKVEIDSKENGLVRIYDLSGKLVQTSNKNSLKQSIPLNLPKGIYLVEFDSGKNKSTQKLIIQ
jgi:hypothetical protein